MWRSSPNAAAALDSDEVGIRVRFPDERKKHERVAVGSAVIAQNPRLQKAEGGVDFDAVLRFFGDHDAEIKASLRECLASQFEIDGRTYVLDDGTYYEVNREFVAEVDASLQNRIAGLDGAPDYMSAGEDSWLDDAVATGRILKIHPETYNPTGGVGKVELADAIDDVGTLLHVKVGANAAAATAVTRQAMSAAEALVWYGATSEWLVQRQLVPPFGGLEQVLEDHPRPRIGVVLLGRDGNDLSRVSLFAKLALQRACMYLAERDFRFRIYFVPKPLGD